MISMGQPCLLLACNSQWLSDCFRMSVVARTGKMTKENALLNSSCKIKGKLLLCCFGASLSESHSSAELQIEGIHSGLVKKELTRVELRKRLMMSSWEQTELRTSPMSDFQMGGKMCPTVNKGKSLSTELALARFQVWLSYPITCLS